MHVKLHAAGGNIDLACRNVGLLADSKGFAWDRKPIENRLRMRIIPVHHSLPRLRKNAHFCRKIVFKGFMVIQMILRQVGKDRRFKFDAVHAALIQRMGGSLHHHKFHAFILHLAQNAL